jgi:gamma-glutamyltranspeptidase/glutathione hydrolase
VGHAVEDENAALARGGFGGGQGIMIDPASGAYWGGSDRRKDGCAIGF